MLWSLLTSLDFLLLQLAIMKEQNKSQFRSLLFSFFSYRLPNNPTDSWPLWFPVSFLYKWFSSLYHQPNPLLTSRARQLNFLLGIYIWTCHRHKLILFPQILLFVCVPNLSEWSPPNYPTAINNLSIFIDSSISFSKFYQSWWLNFLNFSQSHPVHQVPLLLQSRTPPFMCTLAIASQ